MNKSPKHRIPLLVSLTATLALSVSACGHLSYSSDSNSSGSNSANSTTTGPALPSGQGGATTGSSGTVSGSGGQSGVASNATGGSTGGSSAQFGAAGSAAAGSTGSSPGQFGAAGSAAGSSGGVSGVSTAATGMSPDQVAQWCKGWNGSNLLPPDNVGGWPLFGMQVTQWQDLEKISPVQYTQNFEVIIADYRMVANQTRLYPQVRDEIKSNYDPIKQFGTQICQ